MNPRYHIGSGYHASDKSEALFHLWIANTLKYSNPWPQLITIIADSGSKVPKIIPPPVKVARLELSGNLGHFMNLINNEKPHAFNGWSGSVLALAMIAYCDEADFIYKEQDCFAFGPWVETLYEEIGDAGAVWGNSSFMPCEQSLFLVKHAHIPAFVARFIDGGPQRTHDQLGEHRFVAMEQQHPTDYKRFRFGVGRDRPIPWDAKVFYFQKPTNDELQEGKERGMI